MKASTLSIIGKSGQKYVFHTYPLPAQLTPVGGVYMYLKKRKSDFKILKIGSTHNFSREMGNTGFIKKMGATHITALQKNSKSKQDQIIRDIAYLTK